MKSTRNIEDGGECLFQAIVRQSERRPYLNGVLWVAQGFQ